MAFIHGKDTKVIIDSTDLSAFLNSAEPSRTADVGETTTFGTTGNAKTYIAGSSDATVSFGGFFDATADNIIQGLVGTNDKVAVIGFDGIDATDDCMFGKGVTTNYGISSPVGDVVAVTFDLQASGFFSGNVLENATVTASGNGTARDNGSSTANGGGAFIVATSVSGTSTPTLTAKITHSADNVSYADLVTFTALTSAGAEVKEVALGTTVNRYLKVVYTVSGTNPSFNVIVGFGRKN
jgi:hypothetical protein